jgi:hypothetical protein
MSDDGDRPDKNLNQNPTGRLVYSPTGGGPLVPGNPGNRGGKPGRSGRPPSVIREACRMKFDRRVSFLARVADGKVENATVSDRLRAMQLLGTYGLDSRTAGVDINEVRDKVAATIDVIRRVLPNDKAVELIAAIRPVWKAPGP